MVDKLTDVKKKRFSNYSFASGGGTPPPLTSTAVFNEPREVAVGPDGKYNIVDTVNQRIVQMTSDVARAVVGMDITTVQWESKGGMQLNFKVMCINVPQIRADFYGNCGILHATTS